MEAIRMAAIMAERYAMGQITAEELRQQGETLKKQTRSKRARALIDYTIGKALQYGPLNDREALQARLNNIMDFYQN